MKRLAPALAIALLVFPALSAHADAIYNFALVSSGTGQAAGSGSFTLSSPPPSTGTVDYFPSSFAYATPGEYLLALTISVDNPGLQAGYTLQSFFEPEVQFTDGILSIQGFYFNGGTRSQGFATFSMNATQYSDSFLYFGFNGFPVYTADMGSVTVTPQSAITPEPPGLALLATGVLALWGSSMRRRSVIC